MPFAPEQIGPEARKRLDRAFCACVGAFSVVGVAVPMAFARAIDATYFINVLLYAVARLMEMLLNFFGTFVTMLVDVVINVAMYNSFVSAAPVQAGWPLIRDVVNMLFIIVLLITAFATIIQYKRFDYRQVLPKLLLMVVLVNFSRTLIGLMIDFSQVMMLTFVNGFRAAAAGNFVDALKLDKVLQWAKTNPLNAEANNLSATLQDSMLVKIVLAEMLGMFMLGTMLVTLLIMAVYLVGRVVGLWIALILSPAAFFAIAIESTPLAKGLSFISGSFWPRLGAMLSGGPIMAFFLWLALGTVQSGGFGNFDAARTGTQATETIQYFSTFVGNTQEIATFLVAVMMMLMGVEAAVSIAGQVSSTLGKATGKIRDVGMRATRLASYGALAGAGSFAARRAGRVAAAGARFADSRADFTGKVGSIVQRAGGIVPVALGGRSIQAAGGKLRAVRGDQRAKEQKGIQAAQSHMHADEQIADLERIIKSNEGKLGNADRKRAAQLDLAKLQSSKDGMGVMKKRFEEEGKKKNLEGAELEAYAVHASRLEAGLRMKDIEEEAKHDAELKKQYDEETEKNPDYILSEKGEDGVVNNKKFSDNLESMAAKTDAKGLAARIGLKSYSDPRTADWIMKNTDILNEKGEWNTNSDYYKSFVQGGGPRKAIFDKRREDLAASASNGNAKTALATADVGSINPGYYVKGENGSWNVVSQEILTTAGAAGAGGAVTVNVNRRESEISAARSRIDRLRRNAGDAQLPEGLAGRGEGESGVRDAQFAGMVAGGGLAEMYAVDTAGKFNRSDDRNNFRRNMARLTEGDIPGDTNSRMEAFSRVDLKALERNPNDQNEARSIFASSAQLDGMAEAHALAEAKGNQSASKNIARAVQVVHEEGSRVENAIRAYNEKNPNAPINVEAIADYGLSGNQEALDNAVEAYKQANNGKTITMDEAKSLANKQKIDGDKKLQVFRKQASSRASHVAQNARGRRPNVPRFNPRPSAPPAPPMPPRTPPAPPMPEPPATPPPSPLPNPPEGEA